METMFVNPELCEAVQYEDGECSGRGAENKNRIIINISDCR